MLDGEINGKELTVKHIVAFLGCKELPAEKKTRGRGVPSMIWLMVERKRGAPGAGKHRVVADVRDFLCVMKASSCRTSHNGDFGLPDRAYYEGAMM